MDWIIRKGKVNDLESVLELIQELADYEKEGDQVSIGPQDLKDSLEKNHFDFFVAESDGRILGAAIYYYKFSTWKGKCLYLEDLIVTQECREMGIGTALFNALAKLTHEESLQRMEWQVLDWNAPAISFYKKYNCRLDPEWINGKLTFEDLNKKFNEGL